MTEKLASPEAGESYPFRIGRFHCLSLSDGYHIYRLNDFYAGVPLEQINAALGRDDLSIQTITTPYSCVYIDNGKNRIMVDVGGGKLLPNAGRLLQSMSVAGLSPLDIDAVIITHAHPDHIGGILDEEGRLVFPNAGYYIWRDEYDYWFSDSVYGQAPDTFIDLARRQLGAIGDRLTLTDRETEILVGVRLVATPGHTPGHIAVAIQSGDDRLLHIADAALSPLHLNHPTWTPVYDIEPEMAAESKQRIFDRAARENSLVFAHHFPPFPNLGRLKKQAAGWLWLPIQT